MAIDSPKNDFAEKHRWLTYADEPDTVYDGSKIMDGSVTTDKLADYAVTTDKIDDESITLSKMDTDVLNLLEGNVKGFDTVADMQAATLAAGNICHTNGFYASGDGGAAFYKIAASGTANGMDVLACGDLFANLVITESYVTPEMFGAYANREGDSTEAIKAAYAKAKTTGKSLIANGIYIISDTLSFNNYPVDFSNSIICYNGARDKDAILLSGYKCDFSFGVVLDNSAYDTSRDYSSQDSWHGWESDSYIGIAMQSCYWCSVNLLAIYDFTIGLQLRGTNGWNNIDGNVIRNCRIGIDIYNTDDSATWNNANKLSNFEINYSSSTTSFVTASADRICVNQHFDNAAYSSCNGNTFSNFKFEWHQTTKYTCCYFESLAKSVFDNCRFELPGSGSHGFIVDYSKFNRNVYAQQNTCFALLNVPSLEVTRNTNHIMPSNIEIMKIIPSHEDIWVYSFTDKLNNESGAKVQANYHVLKNNVYATGLKTQSYSSQLFHLYEPAAFMNGEFVRGTVAGGAIAYYIDMPSKCNLKINTLGKLPNIQCFDSSGNIINDYVSYGAEYGLPTINNSYNYQSSSTATKRQAYLSFANTVRYAKLLFTEISDISIESDANDTIVHRSIISNDFNLNDYPGLVSDVVPTLTDGFELYTRIWDIRSAHLGHYWQLELSGTNKAWVYY